MRDKLLIASAICLFLAMIISAVAWGGETGLIINKNDLVQPTTIIINTNPEGTSKFTVSNDGSLRYFDGCNWCVKEGDITNCTTLYCGGRISILKVDSEGIDLPPESEDMKVIWDKECKCLEVETKTAKFRIYPCGKVEKLEWKEINKNEEQGRNFIIYPNTHDVPLTIPFGSLINSR